MGGMETQNGDWCMEPHLSFLSKETTHPISKECDSTVKEDVFIATMEKLHKNSQNLLMLSGNSFTES